MASSFWNLADTAHISPQMCATVLREKFFDNTNDPAVRSQAIGLIKLLRASGCQQQIISEILHAVKASGSVSAERAAEIGFAMGMQYGFELNYTYPASSDET